MEHFRRTWYVAFVLLGSLALAVSALAADVTTLRHASAPVAEATRYLVADALLSVASALALAALLTARPWAPAAMLGWMVTLLGVLAWILFIALGSNGPSIPFRLGLWLASALITALSVQRVRQVLASGERKRDPSGGASPS